MNKNLVRLAFLAFLRATNQGEKKGEFKHPK